ncbi:MAG: hypothetical protein Kow0058_12970 [Roseovarius sp.]
MGRALAAGVMYFAAIFAAGIVLGTARVLLLVPRIGETAAVAAELPLMLALSWGVAGALIARARVPAAVAARLVMGSAGLMLLLVAEAILATRGLGQSLAQHLAHYATAAGALGLAGQLGFGLMPLLRRAHSPVR